MIRKSVDEFSSEVYSGFWHVPGDKNESPGVLDIGSNTHLRLRIEHHACAELLLAQRVSVIYGFCDGNKRVVLLDSVRTHNSKSLSAKVDGDAYFKATFEPLEAWIGDLYFSCKEDIAFDKVQFRITNLENWKDTVKNFSVASNPDVIRHTLPDDVLVYDDDFVNIKCSYESQLTVAYNKSSVGHCPFVSIVSKHGKLRFYGDKPSFIYYCKVIATILGLMIGKRAAVYDVHGFVNIEEPFGSLETRHIWRHEFPSETTQILYGQEMYLPAEAVQAFLPSIVRNFIELGDAVLDIASRLLYLRNCKIATEPWIVPELVFMFEGLQRVLCAQGNIAELKTLQGYLEYSKCKAQVLKLLYGNEMLCKWVDRNLNYKLPKMAKRFLIARDNLIGIFPLLKNADQFVEFVDYLLKIRDGHAHSELKSSNRAAMCLPSRFWLEGFLTAMIFNACGVPGRMIYDGLRRVGDFRWAIGCYKKEFAIVDDDWE